MPNQKLYDKAKQLITKHCEIHWDDLSDTNSLWDYIEEDMSEQDFKDAVYEAMADRIAEDDGAQMAGLGISDIWHD